jgi:hypothetical protein
MKILLTVLIALCSLSNYAQTTKGSFMIGGSGSMSFDKSDANGSSESKSTSVSVSPEAGYFFARNFAVGLSLPVSLSGSKFASSSIEYKGKGHTIGVAPFVRFYIPVRSFFIITEGSYGWQYSKKTYDNWDAVTGAFINSNEYSNTDKGYSLGAGPAFFLSPYTSIEILANYRNANLSSSDHSMFYISIGFQIYLPSNKE